MIVLYVGPFLGFIFMAAIVIAYVKVCNRMFRIWRGSRRLRACSQWDCLQGMCPPGPKQTAQAGPVKRKETSGRVMMILGALLLIWDLLSMAKAIYNRGSSFIQIVFLVIPLTLIYIGRYRWIGTRTITCPHCRKSFPHSAGAAYYICPDCGKSSIRQREFFTSEEYLRSLPQFQDLPKL